MYVRSNDKIYQSTTQKKKKDRQRPTSRILHPQDVRRKKRSLRRADQMAAPTKQETEIVFFDLETNVPKKPGQRFWVLEFGAIIVCPQKLTEIESYTTLIKPGDLSVVALRSSRGIDGITRDAIANAPTFEEVADHIFDVLNGRIWAGHNIQRFDCIRLKEAFADVGKPAPQPVGMIDSLGVLTEKFGRRAGNMKMASLATYFGLGEQKHRSLDDVRTNLEVLKHCATVLFLESSLPGVLNGNWQQHGSSTMVTRSKCCSSNGRSTLECSSREESTRKSPPPTLYQRPAPYPTTGSPRNKDYYKRNASVNETKPTGGVINLAINNFLRHSRSILRS